MLNMNPDGVIYMGSFSKVLTPGIRLGYVVAPLPLVRRLELAKQAADLHTAQLTQMVVHEVIKDGFLDRHIPTIRTLYANQCQAMLDAMDEHFPAGVSWTKPEGGMFIWVTLPKHIDAMKLLDQAHRRQGRVRAGRAVLRQRAGNQHPAPVVRHRLAGTHPRRHRHPRQADLRAGVKRPQCHRQCAEPTRLRIIGGRSA